MKKSVFVLFIALALLLSSCSLKQIEDTNGEEDASLATLTDDDIINGSSSISYVSVQHRSDGKGSLSVDTFSGVKKVDTIKFDTDAVFNINVRLDKGNLAVVLIKNDEIVHRIPVNEETEISLEKDVKYKLVVAGESAGFKIEYNY